MNNRRTGFGDGTPKLLFSLTVDKARRQNRPPRGSRPDSSATLHPRRPTASTPRVLTAEVTPYEPSGGALAGRCSLRFVGAAETQPSKALTAVPRAGNDQRSPRCGESPTGARDLLARRQEGSTAGSLSVRVHARSPTVNDGGGLRDRRSHRPAKLRPLQSPSTAMLFYGSQAKSISSYPIPNHTRDLISSFLPILVWIFWFGPQAIQVLEFNSINILYNKY
jgi:hypothetical protein